MSQDNDEEEPDPNEDVAPVVPVVAPKGKGRGKSTKAVGKPTVTQKRKIETAEIETDAATETTGPKKSGKKR
jgi:hypothetical protein